MDDSVNNNTELTTQKNDEMEVEESEKDSSFSKTLRSYVWNHCTKRTPNIAICNLCKGEFNTTSGSTSTLLRHLNSKHKSAVDNYKIDVESKNKSFTKDSLKAKEMTKALSLLVTVGLQPSSILNEQTFINFTKVAEPRFSIPTVEEFSSKIIPDLFNEEKERFKDIVGKDFKEEYKTIAISINGFTKCNIGTFIAPTLHYINSDFKCQNITLDIKELPTSVSAETIVNYIDDLMTEWKILPRENCRIYFTVENTEVMKEVISSDKTWQKIPCLFNIIEESVMKAIEATESFIDLSLQCIKIVKHFKENSFYNERLKKLISTEESINRIKLPSDNWYSHLQFFQKLLQIRISLRKIVKENSTSINLLAYEWEIIKEYVEVLEAISDTVDTLKSFTEEQFPSLSCFFPILKGLIESVNGECDLATRIVNEVTSHFLEINKIDVIKVSMILDPRFKDRFMENKNASTILKLFMNELNFSQTIDGNTEISKVPTDEGEPKSKVQKFLMQHYIAENLSTERRSQFHLSQEINGYLETITTPITSNPITWWSENGDKYPSLKKVAKEVLIIPSTMVPKYFNHKLQILRSKVDPEDVPTIGFLHSNLKSGC